MMRREYRIFPALVLLLLLPVTVLTQDALWKTYIDAGTKAYEEKRYIEAERRFKLAYKEAENFGPQDPRLALSCYKLARLYFNHQDRFAEAKQFSRQALAIWEKNLGTKPLEVANNLEALAGILVGKGEYADVELLLTQALEIKRKVLKPEHPGIAATLSYLAITNYLQKKFLESSSHFKQALAIYTSESDTARHEDIIVALRNFATINKLLANYAEAESFLQRALEFREKNREPEHVDIEILYELADLYSTQKKYAEAEKVLTQRLEITQRAYGTNNSHVALAMANLADACAEVENYSKAESLYKDALAILGKVTGDTREMRLKTLDGLTSMYQSQGEYAAAEPLVQQCLKIVAEINGTEHQRFADYLNTQGTLFLDQEKYAGAEHIFKQSLDIRERVLKPDHPDIANSLNNLAKSYYYQGKYDQAEPLYRKAISISQKYRDQSPAALAWYTKNYALLLYAQGKNAQAEPLFRDAQEVFARSQNDSNVAFSLYELAELYRHQKKYDEAEPLFKKALALMKAPGQNRFKLATTLEKYASLLRRTNREAEAISLETQAREIKSRYARKP